MEIKVPPQPVEILRKLESKGFETYLVGGCVRDSLLGIEPKDWDIATSALPEQVMDCFGKGHVVPTGIRHGTVSVILDHRPYEVTTFREDGTYSDGRRPDTVTFVSALRPDLARRDFTVNALAYHPRDGILDYFNGLRDLAEKRIVCVGDPAERMKEDALRILRAVRFASVLGFQVEAHTAKAMRETAPLLEGIALERVRVELDKAVLGLNVEASFKAHADILMQVLPELAGGIGSAEWCGIVHSIARAPVDLPVRLAILVQINISAARDILARLRYDHTTRDTVLLLLQFAQSEIDSAPSTVKRCMNRMGEDQFRKLIALQKAMTGNTNLQVVERTVDTIVNEKQCYCLQDLAVNGHDLLEAGISPGAEVGKCLQQLLEKVMDGVLINERVVLLEAIRMMSSDSLNKPK